MSKVVDIKTKEQLFTDWLDDVVKVNNLAASQPTSAMLLWASKSDDGVQVANSARCNVTTEVLEWWHMCMADELFERKMNKFFTQNLDRYICKMNGDE